MHLNFNALPNLIALAILVGVFAAIARQHTNERVHFWLVGWALVLLRSVVQFAHVGYPHWASIYLSIALIISGAGGADHSGSGLPLHLLVFGCGTCGAGRNFVPDWEVA